MRLIFVPIVAVGLAMAGCSSTPEETVTTSGQGSSVDQPSNTANAAPQGFVSSSPVDPAQQPGTQEHFVREVGDRVFFGFDRFDLSPEAREVLERQAVWLKEFPGVSVAIEGHADERGTREYNLALGERRANSVRNYLIALGIDPNRVTTISFGKERPVDPRNSEEAWERNRRGVTVVGGMQNTSRISN